MKRTTLALAAVLGAAVIVVAQRDGGPPAQVVALFDGDFDADGPIRGGRVMRFEGDTSAGLRRAVDARMPDVGRITGDDPLTVAPLIDTEDARGVLQRAFEPRARLEFLPATRIADGETCLAGRDELCLEESRRGFGGETTTTSYLARRGIAVFDEHMVSEARTTRGDAGIPAVLLTFTPVGRARFATLTGDNLGRQLAIVIDGELHSAPMVKSVIDGGQVMITLEGPSERESWRRGHWLVAALRAVPPLPDGARWRWVDLPAPDPGAELAAAITCALGGALWAMAIAWALARWVRSERAPGHVLVDGPRRIGLARIAIGVAGIGLMVALVYLPWPMPEALGSGAHVGAQAMSVGLGGIVVATLLVSLAVNVVPRLRPLSDGGLAARAKLRPAVLVLTALFAVGQAWLLARRTEAGLGYPIEPTERTVILLILVGGGFAMLGVAGALSRWGTGQGVALLFALSAIGRLPEPPSERVALYLAFGALALVATGSRLRDGALTRRLPLIGVAPLDGTLLLIGLALMLAPALAGPLAMGGPAMLALLVALALVATKRYAAPLAWRRWALPGGLGVAALLALAWVRGGEPTDPIYLVALYVPAIVADWLSEARFTWRHALLARVASTHDVDQADRWLDALRSAGVPAMLRGARTRAMFRFLGPWLPVELWVPSQARDAAEVVLREAREAHVIEAFAA